MPRVRDTSSEENVVPRKPRARKPRATSGDSNAPISAPRKRTAPKAVSASVSVASETVRKAPTQIKSQKSKRQKNSYALLGVFISCLLVTFSGIGLGFSDRGQIDVVAVVNDRNEKINKGEIRDANGQPIKVTVPVQNSDTRPNGGLTIADPVDAPEISNEVAVETQAGDGTETASSSATSTETTVNAEGSAVDTTSTLDETSAVVEGA